MKVSLDDRYDKIIQLLSRKSYSSIDEMSLQLKVNKRTIEKDIALLNKKIKEIGEIQLDLEEGYTLNIKDYEKFKKVKAEGFKKQLDFNFPKKRMAYLINKLIKLDKFITIDELAEEMMICRTTLINDIKKIKVVLKSYDLKINGKTSKGIYLTGDEWGKRFIILQHIYDYFYPNNISDPILSNEVKMISNLLELDQDTEKLLRKFIVVCIYRLKSKHFLQNNYEKYESSISCTYLKKLGAIYDRIESLLEMKLPKIEKEFLTLPLSGRRTPTNVNIQEELFVSEEILHLFEKMMLQIERLMFVRLDHEKIFEDLKYHLTFMVNRVLFNIKIKNPLLSDVQYKYPAAYEMAEIGAYTIEKELKCTVPKDEIGFLAVYFAMYILENEIHMNKPKNIAIVCNSDGVAVKMIETQLKAIMKDDITIETYLEKDKYRMELDSFDIIFTTIPLDLPKTLPIIKINELFDGESLSKQIEKLLVLKKQNNKIKSVRGSYLETLIEPEGLIKLDSNLDYETNVKNMVETLRSFKELDDGFYDRLVQREKEKTMIFDKKIAFPHTINLASEEITIGVGISEKPIIKNGLEVNLIFLLAVPKETTTSSDYILMKLYDEIFTIFNDKKAYKKIYKKIVETKNYYEEIKNLKKGE